VIASQLVLHVPVWQRSGFSLSYLKESMSFGIRQWASEVTHFLTARLDFFIVAWLSGEAGLGIYSVAVGLAEIVSRLAYELGTMMFPAVAAGSLRHGQAPVILRTSVALAALLGVVIAGLAGPLVVGLFGAAFAEAVPVLKVLLIGTVAWSAAQILWLYASGAGKLELVLLVLGGATVLDLVLNLILQPRMGVFGAGVAATIAYCAAAAALLPAFCRREGCTIGEALLVRVGDLRRLASLTAEILNRFRTRARAEEQL
jgi:O-antigen/teichoic acid export membrane protein